MQYHSSSHDGLGDAEKIFNLQLAISKLQEEVSLYRNGVDVPQLLELIKEKDNEIDLLKETLTKTEDKNFSLLQSRADLLSKQENLLDEIQQARTEKSAATNKTLVLEETVIRKENEIKSLEQSLKQLEDYCTEREEQINILENSIRTLDGNIFELQNRCAKLVREKGELSKTIDKERNEKTRQITEYRNQIDKSIIYNNEIKEKFEQEHTKGLDLAIKLKTNQKELSSATDEIASLTKQMEDYKLLNNHNNTNTNDKILSTSRLHSTGSNHTQLSKTVPNTQHIPIPSSQESLFALAASVVEVSSLDMNQAIKRIAELEDQVKRQDKYMKSKILRDKTNFIVQQTHHSCPENNSYHHEPQLQSLNYENYEDNVQNILSPIRLSSDGLSKTQDRLLTDSIKRRPLTRRRRSGSNPSSQQFSGSIAVDDNSP